MIKGTFENTSVRHINGKAELLGSSVSRTESASGTNVVTFTDVPQQGAELNVKLYSNNMFSLDNMGSNNTTVVFMGEEPFYLFPDTPVTATAYTSIPPTAIQFNVDGDVVASASNAYSCTYTPTDEVPVIISFYWSSGVPADAKFKFEEGSTSTPFTAYSGNLSGTTVTVSGKNLFNVENRVVRNFGALSNTTQRNFTENSVYLNLALNNYCNAGHKMEYAQVSESAFTLLTPSSSSGGWEAYGAGFNFKVKPNTVYSVSATYDSAKGRIAGYNFYDASGNYISNVTKQQNVTTPANCYWMNVVLGVRVRDEAILFDNVQLEENTVTTAFEPYQEAQSYTVTGNGKTSGLTAFAPTTIISAENANINASYIYEVIEGGAEFTGADRLKSFEVERLGESKFFGYGIAQKANIKLIDTHRELDFKTSDKFKLYLNDTGFTPALKVTEVHRDEKTNALSITAYDALEQAQAHTVAELTITSYSIGEFTEACATLLGLQAVLEPLNEFDIYFDGGANFEGTESIREALNDVAEATQTIYFINANNQLVFKRLEADEEPVVTIDKANYFELESKTNRRLTGICSATELGDNVEATLDISGTMQYVRNNAFWELHNDIDTLVENALSAVGGLTIAQFEAKWRGNYLVEPGDKIALQTKDDEVIISYLLNDTVKFNGGLNQVTKWEYENAEESANNPTTLGEALKYTYARVDKQEKQIDIVASEIGVAQSAIASMQVTTDKISASVSAVEKTATEAVEGLNKELNTLTQKVNAQITAEDLTIEVEKALESGVDAITTTTGFTFNEEGLKITKSSTDISTTVTEDGMQIKKGNKDVLTANNEGVKAIDLHATTFLIIGKNSRLEDYKSSRTACFWIGG